MIDFWIDFLAILASFWGPSWGSNCQYNVGGNVGGNVGWPSVAENDPRCHPGGPKTISRRPKMYFEFHFGANLASFWHPTSTKIRPKIDTKRHHKKNQFLDRFFGYLGSILGAKLRFKLRRETSADRALRKMSRDASQGAPRRFPDGPKMLFQPAKMTKIGWEPTQDELTQDEGEYFSMGKEVAR